MRKARLLLTVFSALAILAVATGVVVASAPGVASAAYIYPPNPAANITPPCSPTWVAAINCARYTEGVGELPVSAQALDSLTKVAQIFAITNLERIGRGIPAVLAMTKPLDAAAQAGADVFQDPHFSNEPYWSNVISDTTNPLRSDFIYMYNDGFGSRNLDCQTSPSTAGCWGHRKGILAEDTCRTGNAAIYSMGGAVVAPGTNSVVPGGSEALIIFATCNGVLPSTQTLTWPQLEVDLGIAPAFQTSTRIYGTTADATAAAELEHQFSTTCPGTSGDRSVVLATDAGYADALASSYLARTLGSGILLTAPTSLSQPAKDAIEAEGITHVYVVGGSLAVSTGVLSQVESLPIHSCHSTQLLSGHPTVTRIAGSTEYTTAAAIAEHPGRTSVGDLSVPGAYGKYNASPGSESVGPSGQGPMPTAIVATGAGFQDAEAASVLSYAQHLPILLTTPSELSPQTSAAISKLGIAQVVVMGGTLAVSDGVVSELEAMGVSVLRIAGATAGATSVELADFETTPAPGGPGWVGTGSVTVARGNGYTDGLAGAVVAADGPTCADPAPLVLATSPTSIGMPLIEFLERAGRNGIGGERVSALTVLGGPAAVSAQLVGAMGGAL